MLTPAFMQGTHNRHARLRRASAAADAAPSVPDIMHENLLNALSYQLSKVCVTEFHASRRRGELDGENAYSQFLEYLATDEVQQALYQKYPVLTSKLNTIRHNWFRSNLALLTRYATDRAEIQRHLLDGHSGQLSGLKTLGDPHNGGTGAMCLSFDSGLRCMYKPRNLAVDTAMNQVISWIGERLLHPLKTFQVLERGTYGWCAYVEHTHCSGEALSRHYYRLGSLLAIAHAFNLVDIHAENLIASGEFPVIVDFECVFSHRRNRDELDTQTTPRLVSEHLILPNVTFFKDSQQGYDGSVLGYATGALLPLAGTVLSYDAAGEPTFISRYAPAPAVHCHPEADGERQAARYQGEFTQGFSDAYRVIKQSLPDFLKTHPTFSEAIHARVIIANTPIYAQILNNLNHPTLLTSVAESRRYILHNLTRARELDEDAFTPHEVAALENGDIPYFERYSGSDPSLAAQQPWAALLPAESGHARVEQFVDMQMNEAALAVQLRVIDIAFSLLPRPSEPAFFTPQQVPSDWDAEQALRTLMQQLRAWRFTAPEGAYWPTLRFIQERPTTGLTDHGLYDGTLGLMLCFSWCARQIDPAFQLDARQCFDDLVQGWQDRQPDAADLCGYGMIGGGIFALGALHQTGSEPRALPLMRNLCDHAQTLLETSSRIDVVGGLSGLLIQLLRVEPVLLADHRTLITHCANRIVEQLETNGISATGYAHGWHGVAAALARYVKQHPNDRVSAILEHLGARDDSSDAGETGSHPATQTDSHPTSPVLSRDTSWCHGSIGHGLARAALYEVSGRPRDIDAFRRHFAHAQRVFAHSTSAGPCHGVLGYAELLRTAHTLGEISTTELQAGLASTCATALARCDSDPQRGYIGAMIGRTGLAWELLRTLAPEQVPALLI